MLATGNVLHRIRRLGNDRLGMRPIRVLNAGPNDFVFWRASMRNRVRLISIKRESAHQVVGDFAQRSPIYLFCVQLFYRSIKNSKLSLHSSKESKDVVRIRFIDGSAGKFFGRDAEIRVAFIAEKIDVAGDIRPNLMDFGFAI